MDSLKVLQLCDTWGISLTTHLLTWSISAVLILTCWFSVKKCPIQNTNTERLLGTQQLLLIMTKDASDFVCRSYIVSLVKLLFCVLWCSGSKCPLQNHFLTYIKKCSYCQYDHNYSFIIVAFWQYTKVFVWFTSFSGAIVTISFDVLERTPILTVLEDGVPLNLSYFNQ